MLKGEFDCEDVDKSVENLAGEQSGFILLYHLTEWMSGCLDMRREEKNNHKYPLKEENKLLKKIEKEVRNVGPDLVRLDVESSKFLGLCLNDYRAGGDVNFHKFLVSSMLETYKSIAKKVSDKLNGKGRNPREKWRLTWRENIDQLVKDKVIASSDSELSKFKKKPDVERYLQLRKDVSSMYHIISKIEGFKGDFKGTERKVDDMRLALQRVFHVTGEYLKYTDMSPNLSEDLREFLMEKGVPVKFLTSFRDFLTHNQLFPLINIDNEQMEDVLDKGLVPIKEIIKKKTLNIEDNFIREIIGENHLNSLLESRGVNVGGSLLAKDILQSYKDLEQKTPNVETLLVQNADRMMSKRFNREWADSTEPIIPENFVVDFIIERKKEMYKQLYDKFMSWYDEGKFELPARKGGSKLDWNHDFAMEIMSAIDQLNYGGTSKVFFRDFINSKNLAIIVKNNKQEEVLLKDEVKKYINPDDMGYDFAFSDDFSLDDANDLIKKSGTNSNASEKLKKFLNAPSDPNASLTPAQYESHVSDLKLGEEEEAKLLSVSVAWKKKQAIRLLKKHAPPLNKFYDYMSGGKLKNIKKDFKFVFPLAEDLYKERVIGEVKHLKNVNYEDAVKSQIINIYSLLDNAQDKNKNKMPQEEKEGAGDETSLANKQLSEEKPEISKFRNYLSHGDTLTSELQQKKVDYEMVQVKNTVITELIDKVVENPLDMQGIADIIGGISTNDGVSRIKEILCPKPKERLSREIVGCLTREDIEEVVKGDLEEIDPDTMKIDSEKLISALSRDYGMSEEKFNNYIALASETEVQGNLENEVGGLVEHHKSYTKHFEKVEKFSGVVMHGMISKDIVGDLIKGNFQGVAIDLSFLGIGVALEKLAKFASVKGASYLLKGNALAGKSLKVASPFLSRGISVFIVYDLWKQVKEMNANNKDAVVSVVGDGIMLTADATELLIEVAEGLSAIEGVSATTGPIGMAVGAVVFLGVEIYKAVRVVDKIDEKIHLSGWEKFVQGSRAFIGMDHSAYLDKLLEEKNGNNEAVQMAIKVLKDNPHLRRYIFPSCVHADGKLVNSLDNVVHLKSKVNDIMWTRTRPDDVSGVNIFCKPNGDWETVPSSGTYYCENAIGVEYATDRTNDYTLINLGEGSDWVEGLPDGGNIFVIDRANKTLFGGNKDDSFIFNRKSNDRDSMVGFIDGGDGLDTIFAEGLFRSQTAPIVADFPSNILNSHNVLFHVHRINKYIGIPYVRDLVMLSCDIKLVDGKGGNNEVSPDTYVIKNDAACNYSTTIVVGSFTEVMNYAKTGEFKYFVHGEEGKKSQVIMEPKSKTKNSFTFQYKLGDIAAIGRSQRNSVQFSFVPNFYKLFDNSAADYSFNLTIEGSGEKNDNILVDNTKIVLGEKVLYALQNTQKPIGDIVEEYSNLVSNLGMYAVVHSDNEVLTISGRHNDILSNDPKARTSHFVGSSGDNIISFKSGLDKLTMDDLPIKETVIHYFNKHSAMDLDLLDFRDVKKQVKNDLDRDVIVEIIKANDDLILNILIDGFERSVMKITLKNVLEYLWYRKIRIVMEAVFIIEETQGKFHLLPSPLIFNDKSDSLFVINPRDVVKEMTIKVSKELSACDFVRNNDSLIVTNSLRPNAHVNPMSTVILNDFYSFNYADKMQSLTIEFDDMRFKLSDEGLRTLEAKDFNDLRKKATLQTYKGILNAIRRTRPLFKAIDLSENDKAQNIIDVDETIVSSKDKWMNPLGYAAGKGNLEIVKYLVEKGADPLAKDSSGHIPAYYSVRNKYNTITDFLLPIHFALGDEGMIAMTSELAIVKYLNEVKSKYYTETFMVHESSTLLHYAAMNGNVDAVKYIMEEGQEGPFGGLKAKDRFEQTPFYYAVKNRHGEVITYMADIMEKEGMTPLSFAAEMGSLEIVKYLVEERKADIYEKDRSGATPLHHAFKNMRRNVIEYLRQVIVREGEGQLMVYAILSDDIDLMKFLIREKASITGLNINGKSPLHYAVNQGNLDMVQLLVKNGADMHEMDRSGYSPLYYAHKKRVPAIRIFLREVVLELIFPEGTLTTADLADEGFLDFFTKHADASVYNSELFYLEYLVTYLFEDRKVNHCVRNNKNQSPLHYAARYGHLGFVTLLVHGGADLFLVDEKGRYAADYAAAAKHQLVEQHLRDLMFRKYQKEEMGKAVEDGMRLPRSLGLDNDGNPGGLRHEFGVLGSVGSMQSLNDTVMNTNGGFLGQHSGNQSHNPSFLVQPVDANSTIMLLDFLIRKVTGQKGVPSYDTDESSLDVQGYALRVVDIFETVIDATAHELGISLEDINFDPLALQSAVIKHKTSGKSSELTKTLYSFAKTVSEGFSNHNQFLEHFLENVEQALETVN